MWDAAPARLHRHVVTRSPDAFSGAQLVPDARMHITLAVGGSSDLNLTCRANASSRRLLPRETPSRGAHVGKGAVPLTKTTSPGTAPLPTWFPPTWCYSLLESRSPAAGAWLGLGRAILGDDAAEFFEDCRVWPVGQSFDGKVQHCWSSRQWFDEWNIYHIVHATRRTALS